MSLLLLGAGFRPWPENFYILLAWPKKKKEREREQIVMSSRQDGRVK